MRIVICGNCGRALHEAGKCYHCGGTSLSPSVFGAQIPEAAMETYEKMEQLLAKRKFSEVLALSRELQKWMSDSAEIYWMRLLAKLECANDLELILHGADLDADEDYSNAAKYADPEAYRVYLDVQEKLDRVRMELNSAVRQHFIREKKALELPKQQQELDRETQRLRQEIDELWLKLVETENRIRILDADVRLALAGYTGSIRRAQELADEASVEANRAKEYSESQHLSMVMRLTAALQMSEEAASAIRAMEKDHPWVSEYAQMAREQQALGAALNSACEALKQQNQNAQSLLDLLHELEREQETHLAALQKGGFQSARKLLGDGWNQVLLSADVVV